MVFVQQFLVKKQLLRICDIFIMARSTAFKFDVFKKYFMDKNKYYDFNEEIKFYRKQRNIYDQFILTPQNDDPTITSEEYQYHDQDDQLSIIYEITSNDDNYDDLKHIFHEQHEPFYDNINDFFRYNDDTDPGLKYNQLGLELGRDNKFDEQDEMKCFEKAYKLDPMSQIYCGNYIQLLNDLGEYEKVQTICFEKLKLNKQGKFHISKVHKFYRALANSYQYDDCKESVKYYNKAVEAIHEAKQQSHSTYFLLSPDEAELNIALCGIYENMAELYDENYEALGATNEKYHEFFEKIFSVRPNSAHYCSRYGVYLKRYGKYEAALKHYMKAIELVETNTVLEPHKYDINNLIIYYLDSAKCYEHLLQYQNAEHLYLKLVQIMEKSDVYELSTNSDWISHVYARLGELYEKKLKLFDKAYIYYTMRIKRKKLTQDPALQMDYIMFLERNNKIDESLKHFETFLDKLDSSKTNNVDYQIKYVKLLNKYKQNDKIQQYLHRANKNHQLLHELSLFYLQINKTDLFGKYKSKCFELITNNSCEYNNYCIKYAKYFQQNKQFKQSEIYFEKVVPNLNLDDSNYVNFNMNYIDFLCEIQNYSKTETLLLGLVKLFPKKYTINYKTGIFYLQQNNFDEARKYYLKSLALINTKQWQFSSLNMDYISYLIKQKKFQETEFYYQKLIDSTDIKTDCDPSYHLQYIKILIKLKQYEKVQKMYNYLDNILPGNVDVNAAIGLFHQNVLNEYEKAEVRYLKCIRINSKENHDNYAFLLYLMGRYDESLNEIKTALDYPSRNEYLFKFQHKQHYYYALVLNKLGKYKQSQKEFKKSIEYYKNCEKRGMTLEEHEIAVYHYEYGMLLWNQLDENEMAIEQVQKACELDSGNVAFRNAMKNFSHN